MLTKERPAPGAACLRFSVPGDELAYEVGADGQISATWEAQLELALALGIRYLCPRFFRFEGRKVNVLDLPNEVIQAFRAASKKAGVEHPVLLTGCGKHWGYRDKGPKPFSYLTPEQAEQRLDRGLEVANILEAEALRIFPVYGYGDDWEELKVAIDPPAFTMDYLRMCDRKIGPAASSGSVKALYVETEKYLGAWSVQLLIKALKQLHSNRIFIALDFGNLQHCGRSAQQILGDVFAALEANLLGQLHNKECDDVPPEVASTAFNEHALAPYHVLPGQGSANLFGCYQALVRYLPDVAKRRAHIGLHPHLDALAEIHLKGGGPVGGNSGPVGIRDGKKSITGIWESIGITWS